MQFSKKFCFLIINPLRPSGTPPRGVCYGIPPSPFGRSPQRGEKIYFAIGFFAPTGRAERKETARWAVLAKEPACRVGRVATEGVTHRSGTWRGISRF